MVATSLGYLLPLVESDRLLLGVESGDQLEDIARVARQARVGGRLCDRAVDALDQVRRGRSLATRMFNTSLALDFFSVGKCCVTGSSLLRSGRSREYSRFRAWELRETTGAGKGCVVGSVGESPKLGDHRAKGGSTSPWGWRALLGGAQVRRIGSVAAGTLVAQTAVLAASPVLTRIYSPEEFGRYAFVFAAIGITAPISALRYELAIPIPEGDAEARRVTWVGLIASAAASVTVLVLCSSYWLLGGISDSEFSLLLLGLPVGVLLSGVFQTLCYWAIRNEAYRSVAHARGATGVATAGSQIMAGLAGSGPIGLVLGDLGGRAIGSSLLIRHLSSLGVGVAKVPIRTLARSASTYRRFALASTPSALVNAVSLLLPLVAVGILYGKVAAGWMFMAQRVMALPSTLLGSATSQVYVAELARLGPERRPALYRETLARVFLIGCPPIALGAIAAPTVFPLVFGAEWLRAGGIALNLAPLYAAQLLSGATISTLDVLQLHGTRFFREVAILVLTVGVFASAFQLELGLTTVIRTYAVVGCVSYVASIALVYRILRDES